MPWLTGKQHVICEAGPLGSGGHRCFVTIVRSADMQGTPPGGQFGAAPPYLPLLFAPPTNSKWMESLTQPVEPNLVRGQEQSSESTDPTQGRAGPWELHWAVQEAADPGRVLCQSKGSHGLSLKPCACCFVALGRPCFFSGPQFSSL